MKKLLLIFVIFISCSKESSEIECNCTKQYITVTTKAVCNPLPCITVTTEVITETEIVPCQDEKTIELGRDGNKKYISKITCN